MGNVAEASTMAAMLKALKTKLPVKRVVIVADRVLMNHEQLDLLEAEDVAVDYIMAVPARRYVELPDHVHALAFGLDETAIKETRDAAGRRLIVTRDAERAREMREHRDATIAAVEKLATEKVDKLNSQDAGVRARGRALTDGGVYHQVQSLIEDAKLGRIIKTHIADGLFSYMIDEAAKARAEILDGTLVLITRIESMDAATVIQRYKALADIERGFRVLKQEIEIAPMYHRLPERIRAHASICFLALVLNRHLRARLRASNRSQSPDRVLQQLRRIQEHRATIGGTMHRATGSISNEQRELLAHLDLPLPDVAESEAEATTNRIVQTTGKRRGVTARGRRIGAV
jgi:transposase